MINQSLPNRDLGSSDSDQQSQSNLLHYVIRVTPYDKFQVGDLKEFISNESILMNYLIATELVPQTHYHLVVSTDSEVSEQQVKDVIRAFIVPLWADPETGKCPRGFGNKQYSIELSTDVDKAVSYALKETTEFYFEGFTQEYIDERKLQSFPKNKPSNFRIEYQALITEFQQTLMVTREFMIRYIKLKAKYGQSVRLSDAYGYALSNLFRRDPTLVDNSVDTFLRNT